MKCYSIDNHEIEHWNQQLEENNYNSNDDQHSVKSYHSENSFPEIKYNFMSDDHSPVEVSSFINDYNFEFNLGYESSEIPIFKHLDYY